MVANLANTAQMFVSMLEWLRGWPGGVGVSWCPLKWPQQEQQLNGVGFYSNCVACSRNVCAKLCLNHNSNYILHNFIKVA